MAPNDSRSDVIDRDMLRHQMEQLVTVRGMASSSLFTVISIFWPSHAVLLVALFSSGAVTTSKTVGLTIGIAGFGFSLAWYLLQQRLFGFIRTEEAAIQSIEMELSIPARLSLFPRDAARSTSKYLRRTVGIKRILGISAISSGMAWLWCVVYYLLRGK